MSRAEETNEEALIEPLPDTSHTTLALEYIRLCACDARERRQLVKWRDDLYKWSPDHGYRKVSENDMRDRLWTFLPGKRCYVRDNGRRRLSKVQPTPGMISGVVEAIGAQCRWDSDTAPGWLDDHRPDPRNIIGFANGLLDVEQYLAGRPVVLIPPTPSWFSTTIIPYNFDPTATCDAWEMFLGDALGGDGESVAQLQEWAGLLLTPDTRYQRLMFLLGAPGTGKGTVIRVLTSLIGPGNCATPRLGELASPFGLESLLNKSAAMVADAHLGGRDDKSGVLDQVLAITGEDTVNVNRKYMDALTNVRLSVRFTVGCNKLPAMPDASVAMIRRILITSFKANKGRKVDPNLSEKLMRELPGIACWALEGLKRLRSSGEFTIPGSSERPLRRFQRQSSSVSAFVEDRCAVGPDLHVARAELWAAWKKWCTENGNEPGSEATFGTNLHAFIDLGEKRMGSDGARVRHYTGLGLLLEGTENDEDGGTVMTLSKKQERDPDLMW